MSSTVKAVLMFFPLFMSTGLGIAGNASESNTISIVADHTYRFGAQDSIETSRALALFGAKLNAVHLAAKYFTHRGVLDHYQNMQNEIYCLAADEIQATVIEERSNEGDNSYYVKISSDITNVDFIRAHIKDLEAEQEEARFPYGREMEQPVMKGIDPARELSRAYRYNRQRQWRIAIIYLDHLEKKYPYWGDLYQAKAIAFYGMSDTENMAKALRKACKLGSEEACRESQSFSSEAP